VVIGSQDGKGAKQLLKREVGIRTWGVKNFKKRMNWRHQSKSGKMKK
jgi:hypothetical protein